jgi:hypothetical protein
MRHPLYFVENDFGKLGVEFIECDRDKNSRAEVVRQIRSGGITPRKIIEVIEPCEDFPRGQVLDVTEELIAEAQEPREPPSGAELRQMLIDLQNDRRRDYRKHGVFGW